MITLRPSGLTWSVVGDDVVVLDLDRSVYLKLNGTAGLLWDRLTDPCTEGELAEALRERYELSEAAARADVEQFVAELRRRGLVTDS